MSKVAQHKSNSQVQTAQIGSSGLVAEETDQLSKSMQRASEKVFGITQELADENPAVAPAVVGKLSSLPLQVNDGIKLSDLARIGVELEMRNGVLQTPIRVEKYGDKNIPAQMNFDEQTSHAAVSKGQVPGTYELRVFNKSQEGAHSEQIFSISRDGKVSSPETIVGRDRELSVSGRNADLYLNISPREHRELYNAAVAAKAQGLELTIEPQRPGVASLVVSNSLGRVLASRSLDVVTLGGETQILLGKEAQQGSVLMLAAAGKSKFASIPENIQTAMTQLKQEGLTLKVELQKAAIYRVENGLGTNLGTLTFGGIEVDARSNVPHAVADQQRLVEFLQRSIDLNRFAK